MRGQQIDSYSAEKEWYDSEDGVDRLSTWYSDGKERAFTQFIADNAPFPPEGRIVEIGGGAGLQGLHWARLFGERYEHSDYAEPMVERARELGLKSRAIDGLDMPYEDGALGGLLMIGTSTIIWDQDMRVRQFKEAYRVLAPGGVAVLVASRVAGLRYGRGLNRSDLRILEEMGFKPILFRDWGAIPGRFWRDRVSPAFAMAENVLSKVGLGIRRTMIVRKK